MFKRLNERLEKFLEISAETRQKVVDARKEQAQKAMDKYAKAQSLADRHAKADIKPSSKGFETYEQSIELTKDDEPMMISKSAFDAKYFDTMDRRATYMSGDRDRAPQGVYYEEIPGLDIHISDPLHVKFEDIDALLKDGQYFIANYDGNCFIGKHIKDVIEQVADFENYEIDDELALRDALRELTDSNADPQVYFGISTFKEIEIEAKVKEFDPAVKEQIVRGNYKCAPEETLADYIVPHLDKYTDEELMLVIDEASLMEGYSNSLFPSGWNVEKFGEYPRRLMQALIASKQEDSAADLWNIYYSRRTFLNGCKDLLQAEVLDHPAPYALELIDAFQDDKEMVFDYIETIAKIAPQAAAAIQKEVEHKLSRWE